jgi:hypothetical protein
MALGFDVRVLAGEAPEIPAGKAAGMKSQPEACNETGYGTRFPLVVEPALAYDQDGRSAYASGDAEDPRINAIVSAVQSSLGPPAADAVIHVHNPTIRKNSAFLKALSELAAKGYALVLHVHDLAEDWRPDVYCSGDYPQPATWACINQRDVRNLKAAGAQQVFFLPNAAFADTAVQETKGPDDGDAGGEPSAGNLILYPVRGIRRKNLGEAVLLSLYLPAGLVLGLTLPPNNPRDLPYYNGWKAAAGAFSAPVRFELGLSAAFDELYRQARAVVSTSVKEGFGLSFLEPLSRGKAVLGRRLPAVIEDFEENGLRFPGLYPQLTVPEGLYDQATFQHRVEQAVQSAAVSYGLDGNELASSIAAGLAGNPDFGRLDETAQAETLSRVAVDTEARAAFLAANPCLEAWWEPRGDPVPAEALAPWSETSYGTRLAALYQLAVQTGGGSPPDKSALLALYLKAEGFHGVGI